MALVNKYMQEEQQRINNQKATGTVPKANYSPVSAAKKATWNVTQPAASYTFGTNPGTYTSRYSDTLDSILAQIANPDQFHYEFNGDELFKSYADFYTQKGKQASLDAMGQAAGLTGGYGSSYGQQVGQQTYQQYLLGLYDKGLELRNAAYGQYRDEMGDLKDTYSAMMQADQNEYGKYTDAYGSYVDELNRQETIRQFNEQQALKQAQLEQEKALAEAELAYKQGLAEEDRRRYDQEWAHQLELEAAAAAEAEAAAAGSSNPGSGGTQVVIPFNGKYYQEDKNGKISEIERPTGKFYEDNTWQNAWGDEIDKRNRKKALRGE